MKKILQIIPAPVGWMARFRLDDGEIAKAPVAFWALIEEYDGTRYVSGYSAGGKPADLIYSDDDINNFDGYELETRA